MTREQRELAFVENLRMLRALLELAASGSQPSLQLIAGHFNKYTQMYTVGIPRLQRGKSRVLHSCYTPARNAMVFGALLPDILSNRINCLTRDATAW